MMGILLDTATAVNGTDVVFGIKDMITLIVGVVGVSTAFITLQLNFKSHKEATKVKFDTMEKNHQKEYDSLKSDVQAEKLTRHSTKKEIIVDTKEKFEVIHKRIDVVRDDVKRDREQNRIEFNKINETMGGVKQDTSELKGMVQTLLNKKQ